MLLHEAWAGRALQPDNAQTAAPCLPHRAAASKNRPYLLYINISDIILPFGIMWSGMEYIFPPCIIITCPAAIGVAPSVIILAIAASVIVFLTTEPSGFVNVMPCSPYVGSGVSPWANARGAKLAISTAAATVVLSVFMLKPFLFDC